MKKWTIITSVIFIVLAIVVIAVFGLPAISSITKDDNTNTGEIITPIIDDDLNEDNKNILLFNAQTTNSFVGEMLDVSSWFTSPNLNDFIIKIQSENENAIINNLSIGAVTDGAITYKILFYNINDEIQDYQELEEFEIIFYNKLTNIDLSYEWLSINELNINLDYGCNIVEDDLDFVCEDLIILENEFKTNSSKLKIEINNALSGIIVIKYAKNTFEKSFNFTQNYEEYFKVFNSTTLKENSEINLFLTNDNENHDDYCAFNTLIVSNGLKIENIEYKLDCDILTIQKLNKSDFKIIAKNLGQSILFIKCNEIIVYQIQVLINEIEIIGVDSEYEFETMVDQVINISPVTVYPVFVPFDIDYCCENNNVNIDKFGNFCSSILGNYVVTITVNDYIYSITVYVIDKVIENNVYFDLYDLESNKVETINANLNEERFYTLNFSSNDNILNSNSEMLAIIENEVISDILQIEIINNVLIKIKFINCVNCSLNIKIFNTNYYSNTINLIVT